LNKNSADVQNNQIDKSNVEDDDLELNDYAKYKDDNTQVCVIYVYFIYLV